MKAHDLIKQYEEELLIIDDSIKFNVKYHEYIIAHNWHLREVAIRGFIKDLKKLLV